MVNSNDRLHKTLNIVLGIIYIPCAIFFPLLYMATEVTIWETNILRILSAHTLAIAGILTPFTVFAGLILSNRLYYNGKVKRSYFIRFLPVIVFIGLFLLSWLLDVLSWIIV